MFEDIKDWIVTLRANELARKNKNISKIGFECLVYVESADFYIWFLSCKIFYFWL
jgi:hypothetical protein